MLSGQPAYISPVKSFNSLSGRGNLNIDIKLSNNDVNRLDLYDIQGKVLLSTVVNQNSNNVSLDVSGLNSGIYFVKVQSKDNLYTKKVQIIK